MASLNDRLRRLESAAGIERQQAADLARWRRAMDRVYYVMENGRRALSGLEPLPPELEDSREDILHALQHVIPFYRRHGGYRDADGAAFLAAWENVCLEKLSQLERSEE